MLTELIILLVIIGVVFIVGYVFKKFFMLVINSIIGFFALFAVKLLLPALVINLWSILFVAIGGIFGLLAVIILHLIGVAF